MKFLSKREYLAKVDTHILYPIAGTHCGNKYAQVTPEQTFLPLSNLTNWSKLDAPIGLHTYERLEERLKNDQRDGKLAKNEKSLETWR